MNHLRRSDILGPALLTLLLVALIAVVVSAGVASLA